MTGRSRHRFVRVWIACSAIVVIFAAVRGIAQSSEERFDRFRLFNGCQPMFLLVEGLPSDALEIGLTIESIQAAVESRLRSARIYTSDQSALEHLYVNVNVVGRAFSWSLEFKKWVYDFASESERSATTWDIGGTGTHGNDTGYILSAISSVMDQFLVEYLRVNESACQ